MGIVHKQAAFLAAMMAFPTTAQAQRLPTDVELRASYCIPVVKAQIELSHTILKRNESDRIPIPTDSREGVVKSLAQFNDRLARLQDYLMPRLNGIDPTGLALAFQRGESDVKYAREELGHICSRQCAGILGAENIGACYKTCGKNDERNNRKNTQCDDLTWLPF